MKKMTFPVLAALLGLALSAECAPEAEFKLTDRGKTLCSVVVPQNASVPHRRAASELAKYLGLISGAPAPDVASVPPAGKYPVFLELVDDKALTADGFRWKADAKAFRIQANTEQALYYGVYRFLKKYGGIRWLVPGEDGEYCPRKETLTVPEQDSVQNPAFPKRSLEFNCANTSGMMPDSWDWLLRNNYVLSSAHGHVHTTKAWKPELGEALRLRACRVSNSGFFEGILTGERIRPEIGHRGAEEMKRLYAEHPEYFALVNGKRVPFSGFEQPCTGNPDVIRIMAKHATMWSRLLSRDPSSFMILNNDATTWCECDRCRALDPASEKKNRFLSTRYWTLLNQVFKETLEKYPNVKPFGLAYQNFQTVPDGVEIDPRIGAGLSFNRRCFRHELDDPACPTNKVFLEYYRAWGKLPNPTYSREEYHAGVGKNYMPSEDSLIHGFRVYKKLGIDGASICTVPPDGTYRPFYDDTVKQGWFCEWQALYLAGEVLWDVNADDRKLLEEANRLYYGPAWEGGMKEFRALLKKACSETPGCFGWSNGSHPGQVLARPGLPEQLLSLLDAAEKAAAKDARALAHVKRDRYLFNLTLVKSAKEYMESFRELKAFEKSSPITMDGSSEDRDFREAVVYSNFIRLKSGFQKAADEKAAQQTFIRVVYEHGFLYFAIDAMENNPSGIVNRKKAGELPWGDDSLELFLSHPNFNGGYCHFAFTRDGALYQARTMPGTLAASPLDSGIEIRTKTLSDRWTAEIKIPVQRLGQDCITGHTWLLNAARNRKNTDGKNEQSSLAGGIFHGAFLPLSLAGKRTLEAGGVKNTSSWVNPSFNDVFKRPNAKWAVNWDLGEKDLLSRGWSLNTAKGRGYFELVSRPENEKDYYVLLKNGNFYQIHKGYDKALRYSFRASGNGELTVMIFRFERQKYPRHLQTIVLRKIKLDSDVWNTYTGDYVKVDPDELAGLVFRHDKGEVKIDDAYFYGIDEKKTDVKK